MESTLLGLVILFLVDSFNAHLVVLKMPERIVHHFVKNQAPTKKEQNALRNPYSPRFVSMLTKEDKASNEKLLKNQEMNLASLNPAENKTAKSKERQKAKSNLLQILRHKQTPIRTLKSNKTEKALNHTSNDTEEDDGLFKLPNTYLIGPDGHLAKEDDDVRNGGSSIEKQDLSAVKGYKNLQKYKGMVGNPDFEDTPQVDSVSMKAKMENGALGKASEKDYGTEEFFFESGAKHGLRKAVGSKDVETPTAKNVIAKQTGSKSGLGNSKVQTPLKVAKPIKSAASAKLNKVHNNTLKNALKKSSTAVKSSGTHQPYGLKAVISVPGWPKIAAPSSSARKGVNKANGWFKAKSSGDKIAKTTVSKGKALEFKGPSNKDEKLRSKNSGANSAVKKSVKSAPSNASINTKKHDELIGKLPSVNNNASLTLVGLNIGTKTNSSALGFANRTVPVLGPKGAEMKNGVLAPASGKIVSEEEEDKMDDNKIAQNNAQESSDKNDLNSKLKEPVQVGDKAGENFDDAKILNLDDDGEKEFEVVTIDKDLSANEVDDNEVIDMSSGKRFGENSDDEDDQDSNKDSEADSDEVEVKHKKADEIDDNEIIDTYNGVRVENPIAKHTPGEEKENGVENVKSSEDSIDHTQYVDMSNGPKESTKPEAAVEMKEKAAGKDEGGKGKDSEKDKGGKGMENPKPSEESIEHTEYIDMSNGPKESTKPGKPVEMKENAQDEGKGGGKAGKDKKTGEESIDSTNYIDTSNGPKESTKPDKPVEMKENAEGNVTGAGTADGGVAGASGGAAASKEGGGSPSLGAGASNGETETPNNGQGSKNAGTGTPDSGAGKPNAGPGTPNTGPEKANGVNGTSSPGPETASPGVGGNGTSDAGTPSSSPLPMNPNAGEVQPSLQPNAGGMKNASIQNPKHLGVIDINVNIGTTNGAVSIKKPSTVPFQQVQKEADTDIAVVDSRQLEGSMEDRQYMDANSGRVIDDPASIQAIILKQNDTADDAVEEQDKTNESSEEDKDRDIDSESETKAVIGDLFPVSTYSREDRKPTQPIQLDLYNSHSESKLQDTADSIRNNAYRVSDLASAAESRLGDKGTITSEDAGVSEASEAVKEHAGNSVGAGFNSDTLGYFDNSPEPVSAYILNVAEKPGEARNETWLEAEKHDDNMNRVSANSKQSVQGSVAGVTVSDNLSTNSVNTLLKKPDSNSLVGKNTEETLESEFSTLVGKDTDESKSKQKGKEESVAEITQGVTNSSTAEKSPIHKNLENFFTMAEKNAGMKNKTDEIQSLKTPASKHEDDTQASNATTTSKGIAGGGKAQSISPKGNATDTAVKSSKNYPSKKHNESIPEYNTDVDSATKVAIKSDAKKANDKGVNSVEMSPAKSVELLSDIKASNLVSVSSEHGSRGPLENESLVVADKKAGTKAASDAEDGKGQDAGKGSNAEGSHNNGKEKTSLTSVNTSVSKFSNHSSKGSKVSNDANKTEGGPNNVTSSNIGKNVSNGPANETRDIESVLEEKLATARRLYSDSDTDGTDGIDIIGVNKGDDEEVDKIADEGGMNKGLEGQVEDKDVIGKQSFADKSGGVGVVKKPEDTEADHSYEDSLGSDSIKRTKVDSESENIVSELEKAILIEQQKKAAKSIRAS